MGKNIPLRNGSKNSNVSFLYCPHCKKCIGIQVKGFPIRREYKKEQCEHCNNKLDWSVKSEWN